MPRLVLLPIDPSLASIIFKEFTPEITVYMVPQPTGDIKDTLNFINGSIEKMKRGEELQFVATDKQTGEFIGCMGLHKINTKEPEMGIWIKKSAQGKGFGKEAMRAIKEWADGNLDYDHIRYPVVKTNIRSRKVAESLGGVAKREFIGKNQNGQPMDEVEYWIYKTAF